MGMFGELFPGRKVRSEATDSGTGQQLEPGPLDLDAGIVYLGRREPQSATERDIPEPSPEGDNS